MILRISRRIYHVSLYVIGALVLIWAICVSMIRLALPYIDDFREDIENWITVSMGFPVEIQKLNATWEGWTPYISLHNINIFDKTGSTTIADFKSAHVNIDIVDSLVKREFVPTNISISGLDLSLVINKDGSINITEDSEEESSLKNTESTLAVWLLNQKEIKITDSTVYFLNLIKNDKTPLKLTDVTISLVSNNYRTQIDGNASLPAWLGNNISFSLDARGDLLTSEWSGESYIEGKNLSPLAWLARKDEAYANMSSAPGQLKLWSVWKNAKIRNVTGEVNLSNLDLASERNYKIQQLKTNFMVERTTDKGFEMNLNINEFASDFGSWPASSIRYKKHRETDKGDNYQFNVTASYIKLQDYLQIARSFPNIFGQLNTFTQATLEGELQNTKITYNPSLPLFEQFWINTELSSLGYKDLKADIHINGLSGTLGGNIYQGKLALDTDVLNIDVPFQYDYPHSIYELNGDIEWFKNIDEWVIRTDLIQGHSSDFYARLNGNIKIPKDVSDIFADLILNVTEIEIDRVADYLPKSMNEKARDWILKALVSGRVTSADVLLRGNLSEYPYRNHEGQFRAVARVENASLDYHPKWTPVDGIEAEITFDGTGLRVDASAGKIFDANIMSTTAKIANVFGKNQTVEIKGTVNGSTNDAKLLISQSPLSSNILLKEVMSNKSDGLLSLDLSLDIPLYGEKPRVHGKLDLHDNLYESNETGISLNNLDGQIEFTEKTISASGINATYFDREIFLDIRKEEGTSPEFIFTGNADQDFIIGQVNHFFPAFNAHKGFLQDVVEGTCDWQAKIWFGDNNDQSRMRFLQVNSSLSGLKLKLPEPLGKDELPRPLELTTTIGTQEDKQLKINYGDKLVSKFNYDQESGNYRSAHIMYDDNLASSDYNDGLHITGHINHMKITEWIEFLDKIKFNSEAASTSNISINITMDSAEFIQQTFQDITLNLSSEDDWIFIIDSIESSGEIRIPRIKNAGPVNVNLEKLRMKKISGEPGGKYNVNKIPAMDIRVLDFQYDDINLGELVARASKMENGINIEQFSFTQPDFEITGDGIWNAINDQDQSRFNIQIHASRFSKMLGVFNYNVTTVEGAETNIEIDANWSGAPMEFSFAALNGTIQMEINKGEFLDFDPAAGRLFGLLSIQTLPRRLSLDFSDIFSKGLVFDQIIGNFNIESGNAYTNNLVLTGPQADIAVSGRTGLANKDYDQIITVIPQVADTLPVASALFGPIGLGVGAVIFLAGELFDSIPNQIDKLLRYQYTVTGSWDEPVVEKYKKFTPEKEVPQKG